MKRKTGTEPSKSICSSGLPRCRAPASRDNGSLTLLWDPPNSLHVFFNLWAHTWAWRKRVLTTFFLPDRHDWLRERMGPGRLELLGECALCPLGYLAWADTHSVTWPPRAESRPENAFDPRKEPRLRDAAQYELCIFHSATPEDDLL